MKIKDDVLQWREEIKKLKQQSEKMLTSSDELRGDVKVLSSQVQNLVKITENMTDAMLALIRQQMGD